MRAKNVDSPIICTQCARFTRSRKSARRMTPLCRADYRVKSRFPLWTTGNPDKGKVSWDENLKKGRMTPLCRADYRVKSRFPIWTTGNPDKGKGLLRWIPIRSSIVFLALNFLTLGHKTWYFTAFYCFLDTQPRNCEVSIQNMIFDNFLLLSCYTARTRKPPCFGF